MKLITTFLLMIIAVAFISTSTYASIEQCPTTPAQIKAYQWQNLPSCAPLKGNQYTFQKVTITFLGTDYATCFLTGSDGQLGCVTKSASDIKPATRYWANIPPSKVCQTPRTTSECSFLIN